MVILPEWGGVDLNDASLHKGVGTDQFVVRSVVDDVKNTRLAGKPLRAPREIASFETQTTHLQVSTADANGAHKLRAELGHGGLATELILPLLAEVRVLTTRQAALMARVPGNTYIKRAHGQKSRVSVRSKADATKAALDPSPSEARSAGGPVRTGMRNAGKGCDGCASHIATDEAPSFETEVNVPIVS